MPINWIHALSLATATACLIAAMCCVLRHVLLRPKPESWPTLSRWANAALFILAAVLLYAGVRLMAAVVEGDLKIPPNATPLFAAIATAFAFYKVTLLMNDYRQRRTWALQQLRQDGFIIQPPVK